MLDIRLTPETEAKLRERAHQLGIAPEAIVEQALQEKLETAELKPPLSGKEWVRAFSRWAESHPPTGSAVDDSRESIYEGRGE